MRKRTNGKKATESVPVSLINLEHYDIVSLPPDTFQKATAWSREVTERRCRRPGCLSMTTRDPAICEDDFYRMLRAVRARVIEKFPKMETAHAA